VGLIIADPPGWAFVGGGAQLWQHGALDRAANGPTRARGSAQHEAGGSANGGTGTERAAAAGTWHAVSAGMQRPPRGRIRQRAGIPSLPLRQRGTTSTS